MKAPRLNGIYAETMQSLHGLIRNCPDPMVIEDGGHFVQEWGEAIARTALKSFGDL